MLAALRTLGSGARRAVALVATPPRVGPFAEGAFSSRLHDERPATWLGIALGVAFGVCFLTGILSDLIQNPQPWFAWTPRPAWLYRVTQGAHVLTGLAAIPLLLAKLWVVYPQLWGWPTVRSAAHAIERVALVPLVAGALFLLVTGVQNIAYWYPWRFSFLTGHYWAAWITIGAMVVHVGAKTGVVGRVWRARRTPDPVSAGGLSRRGLLATSAAASGLLVLTVAGGTVPALRRLAILAPRDTRVGPQGFPVNKDAQGAGVVEAAEDPAWRLQVEGVVAAPLSLTLTGPPRPRAARGGPHHRLRRGLEHHPALARRAPGRPRRGSGWTAWAHGAGRVVAALRPVPDDHPERRVRGRPRHAARPRRRWGTAGAGPRLPPAPHRAEQPRGAADEVAGEGCRVMSARVRVENRS